MDENDLDIDVKEGDIQMTELDANGQIVLDSNMDPMEVLTYYSINNKVYQYLGQWSKDNNFRGFKLPSGRIILKNINSPANILPVPMPERPSLTDEDHDSDFEIGGKIRFKRIRSRKTKRRKSRKTKRRRTRRRKMYSKSRKN